MPRSLVTWTVAEEAIHGLQPASVALRPPVGGPVALPRALGGPVGACRGAGAPTGPLVPHSVH